MKGRKPELPTALLANPTVHRDLFFEEDQNKIRIMVIRQIKFDDDDQVKSQATIRMEPREQEIIYQVLKSILEKHEKDAHPRT